ncbi:hypothetical protein BROUX41_006813 [Berkeleyomyces rouxiae]
MVSFRTLATAFLCTQVFAASYVRDTDNLGIIILGTETSKLLALGPKEFQTEVYLDTRDFSIEVASMSNPSGSEVSEAEALLAIWEEHTKYSPCFVQQIMYTKIKNQDAIEALNSIWKDEGYSENPVSTGEGTIYRPDSINSSPEWTKLCNTRYGSVAIDVCSDFKETQNLYISSFNYGKDEANGIWIRINFESTEV